MSEPKEIKHNGIIYCVSTKKCERGYAYIVSCHCGMQGGRVTWEMDGFEGYWDAESAAIEAIKADALG